jgi:hypothetical protein
MTKLAQAPDPHITWPTEQAPASAMVFAQNVIDVAATPGAVWSQLIDCVRWPQWYKYCSDVSMLRGGSQLSPGSKFRFKTLDRYFEPEVLTFVPERMLVWKAVGPAGTSGAHAWLIEPRPDGCRVITEESQIGWFLFFLRARTRGRLLESHEEWLRALKERAEPIERLDSDARCAPQVCRSLCRPRSGL